MIFYINSAPEALNIYVYVILELCTYLLVCPCNFLLLGNLLCVLLCCSRWVLLSFTCFLFIYYWIMMEYLFQIMKPTPASPAVTSDFGSSCSHRLCHSTEETEERVRIWEKAKMKRKTVFFVMKIMNCLSKKLQVLRRSITITSSNSTAKCFFGT